VEELLELIEVEVVVSRDADEEGQRGPPGGGDVFEVRVDPLEGELAGVLAAGGDGGDGEAAEGW
jgi:hypothetical protein